MADTDRAGTSPIRPSPPPRRDALLWQILAGIAAGALVGGTTPDLGRQIAFLGDLFLRALRMIVVPLVVLSISVGITGLGDIRRLGPLGRRTVVYYLVTTGLAVGLGLLLVVVIAPGARADAAATPVATSLTAKASGSAGEVAREMLTHLIPDNIVKSAAETDVLPLIVVALLFGAVLSTLGPAAQPTIEWLRTLNEAVMAVVRWVMCFAPIGIGCLVAGRLGDHGGFAGFWNELHALLKYALTVILGLVVHGCVVLPLLLWVIGRRRPAEYARDLSPALLTAFSTASSSATLPLTYSCTTERSRVSPRTSGFVLPIGATINMDGTALYEAVAAVFIAQAYHVPLDTSAYLVIFLTATLAAIGAAGIPEAGLVTMILVLNSVGLPTEGIGLIVAIDWFLDRCRTTVNVWGDAVGAAVVDRWEAGDADRC